MIITQMSSPTGMLTRATSMRPIAWNAPGSICPSPMPAMMHRNTHRVRKRSKAPIGAATACFATASHWALMASFCFFRKAADMVQLAPDRHAIELVHRQADEKFDAPLENQRRFAECRALVRPFERGRIFNAPVRRHR